MWKTFKKSIKTVFPFLVPVVKKARNFVKFHVVLPLPVKVLLHLPEKEPRKVIGFEIHLAEHCNLNCAGCRHFSSLAEPEFVSIDDFKRDLVRMGDLFSHKCEWLHLLGGEPLLNPDIIELMKIARENFTEGAIDIVTNGILLLNQNEKFWQACHDNKIDISMTHYPINLDIDKIRKLAGKFGVVFQYFAQIENKDKFSKLPLDLSGKGNAARNFMLCPFGNSSIFLRKGKLFRCCVMSNVQFFNKAFNQNIPITDADYIDIYSDITPGEILRKLAVHTPICSYCKTDKFQADTMEWVDWHISKREISEWI